jgi:hypothetical protein
MLSVNYVTNKQLYNENGMYLKQRQVKRNEFKAVKHKLLTTSEQELIHHSLTRIANRHSGQLPQPKIFATLLKNGAIVGVFDNSVKGKLMDDLRTKTKGKVLGKHYRTQQANKLEVPENEVLDSEDIFDILELASTANRVSTVDGTPIIVLQDEQFVKKMPAYVKQLLKFMSSYTITFKSGVVDFTDLYFKAIFKNWVVPKASGIIQGTVNGYESVIFNNTAIADATILSINRDSIVSKVDFVAFQGTCFTFKTKTGQVRIRSQIRFHEAQKLLNTTYIENYKLLLESSRGDNYDTFGLSRESVIVRVDKIAWPQPRQLTIDFVDKILSRIMDQNNRTVNVVVIANKGVGKSGVLNEFALYLSNRLNIDIGHLSSDAYGRWKYSAHGFALNTDGAKVDYTSAINIDVEGNPSVYEEFAKAILSKANIKELVDYDRIKLHIKDQLISQMTEYLLLHTMSTAEYGELFFYDSVLTSVDRPRVVIVETHFPALNAVTARTDTTCILVTINDARMACRERDRERLASVFLFDVYARLSGRVYTQVYPFELFSERLLLRI